MNKFRKKTVFSRDCNKDSNVIEIIYKKKLTNIDI